MKSVVSPTAPDSRYPEVDTLRGFALLGVLMVNLLIGFRVPLLQHLMDFHTHPGWLNKVVDLLLGILVEEKAITIFATLFGLSMAIQFERCQRRGASYGLIGLRRLLVLAALGLAHIVFVWNGDILTEYAVAGLVVLPALLLPTRVTLVVALALLLLPAVPVRLPLPQLDFGALRGYVAAATRVYSTGGYREIFAFRQRETVNVFIPLLCGIVSRTMGLMLLGQYIWRRGIVQDPAAHRSLLRRVASIGIPLGLLVNIGQVIAAYSHRSLGRLAELAEALSTTPLALGYAALLLLLLQRSSLRPTLLVVANVGRMALSCYLCQSVVLGFVFYGYGLGLFGRLGSAVTAPLGLALFGMQLVGCRWWLERYEFGPIEWLWRSLTYWRMQPSRRREGSGAQAG